MDDARHTVRETTYFASWGFTNTDATLRAVNSRLRRGDIDTVVVATSSGRTALLARRVIADPQIHVLGICFQSRYRDVYTQVAPDVRAEGEGMGVTFLPDEPKVPLLRQALPDLARALLLFGDGTKVAVEVTLMAVEAGLVPAGKTVISIGGTKPGRQAQGGADTALVLQAADYADLSDLFVREILAKPVIGRRGG